MSIELMELTPSTTTTRSALRAGGDLGQDGGDLGPAVVDHRPIHAAHDALGEGRRSGNSQLGLKGHGRAPLMGCGGRLDSIGRPLPAGPDLPKGGEARLALL